MTSHTIFTTLFGAALVFFIWSCAGRLNLIRLGRTDNRLDRIGLRLRSMLRFAIGQKRVLAGAFGINHVVIFWAFVILMLANGAFVLEGVGSGFRFETILPAPLCNALLLAFDFVSLAALVAVLLAFARRLVIRPACLDSAYVKGRSLEGLLILGFIGLLLLASFGLNGVKICTGEQAATFMPVSALAAPLFSSLDAEALKVWGALFWWMHAAVLLAFICFLPLSKHMHILTAIPNCFFQSLEKPNSQPREVFGPGMSYGVARVTDFTWKELFDSFSCTECGRCQSACPAHGTGKSLNPRQVIHSIKINLLQNAPTLKSGTEPAIPLIGPEAEGTTTAESIWACTTCGACMEKCPVLIEQMPKIIKLRRHLVEMEATFPEELLSLFENMEQRSNPWGLAPAERTKWCTTLDVRPFVADTTDYLLYVGCAGAFDSRNKQVTVALTTILDAAGVSWGILGKEEQCCGDSVRRLGNEYLFDAMAKENVRLLKEKGVTRVVTQCPHCFSTLKNDYRQYGLELEVIHHSELIDELLAAGRLRLNRQVTDLGRILFHDSCYLGRHNDVYEPPRNVITAVTGTKALEFERHGSSSFCCGAGGGRMWLEEQSGERININRVTEALAQAPDTICVSCPFCMTMFVDGLKDCQNGLTRVKDIAEVVAEGLHS